MFSNWFSLKSPEQRAKEMREYERWAFPFGQAQREMIFDILKELLPEEDPKMAMTVYLTGREGYRGSVYADPEEIALRTEEEKLRRTVKAVAPHLPNRKSKKFLSRYVALIAADGKMGENLSYPSVEQLRKTAEELEPVLARLPR